MTANDTSAGSVKHVGVTPERLPGAAMPMRVTGEWSVEVGPGSVTLAGREITLAGAVRLEVPSSELVAVKSEKHAALPVFNPNGGGWANGTALARLRTEACSAGGKLVPESVMLQLANGGAPLVRGAAYDIDDFWATVGRLEGGEIGADQSVLIDYVYGPDRLDSVVVDEQGQTKLLVGGPRVGAMKPPSPGNGEVAIANIWVPGRTEKLTEENLYPIEPLPATTAAPQAEKLLPGVLTKLRAGGHARIVAWGDSVTNGGGVGNNIDLWYQHQFAARLRKRFPEAEIEMITAAWDGRSSRTYMDQPQGAAKDFGRDVLARKPDLVLIEFVNDAYQKGNELVSQYTEIMKRMNSIGAEVILIAPHLVRPDWMQKDTMKFGEDPRPYVRGLKQFARERNIALADVSALWLRLWRQGIPYITLLADSINHPDARGHKLFADALMAVFPEQ